MSSLKDTTRPVVNGLIIYIKILLDSDLLRAVQFKCSTSAKKCILMQITHMKVVIKV